MALNLELDPDTNDLVIARGAGRIEGIQYIAQLVKNRLLTVLGEWDLDRTIGIAWFDLLGRDYDLGIIQGTIRSVILETRGVTSVTSLILTPDTKERKLGIAFTGTGDGAEFTGTVTV